MKLVMEGCSHGWVERRRVNEHGIVFGTCTHCFVRLRSDGPEDVLSPDDKAWLPDYAPAPCDHVAKKAIGIMRNKSLDYHDAVCLDCGVVLRHPDGPGEWQEVLFNGFIIEDTP